MKKILALLFASFLFSTTAAAAPIEYQYTGSWTSSNSAPFGPNYVATIVFDNGGTNPANQVFGQADFVSATVVSGSYNFTMLPGDITGWFTNFTSNGAGVLGDGYFNASNSDNFWHFDNEFQDEDFFFGSGGAGFFSSHTSNPGSLVNAVPEPASMLAWGLIVGVGAVGYRMRKRTVATTV